ncbi:MULTISPECIES: hypothetical protein [Neisseria]|uniref:Uncharacterized protein n=1 Tax=Neisseria musculi TaxID=1815583 RepID=A0A7H1MD15_9NEIS|nr:MULTISPECIES: hypothetical protein [Neisseria]MBF0804931.1 hypothetical protein [Neisseria sp. 19428wB4_WF04]QNT59530.1 hypothetical protein H7A79_2186 [Neisseria musculi]TFU39347.1 hypothetical protein E4T99_11540 [Neisseria sp. WF04]
MKKTIGYTRIKQRPARYQILFDALPVFTLGGNLNLFSALSIKFQKISDGSITRDVPLVAMFAIANTLLSLLFDRYRISGWKRVFISIAAH